MSRTHLAITVELVHGMHTGDLWPRPGRVLIAARTTTFEQLGTAIDDAFARWDHSHLHEFTLADGTLITPARWWDGEEPERSLDGDHEARRLGGAIRLLFESGQHPIAEGLQAILRHGRTRHLHDGRAVLCRDLDPQRDAPFVGTHSSSVFSARVTGGINGAYPRSAGLGFWVPRPGFEGGRAG